MFWKKKCLFLSIFCIVAAVVHAGGLGEITRAGQSEEDFQFFSGASGRDGQENKENNKNPGAEEKANRNVYTDPIEVAYMILAVFPVTNIIGSPYWLSFQLDNGPGDGFGKLFLMIGLIPPSYLTFLGGIISGTVLVSYAAGDMELIRSGIICYSVCGSITYLINLAYGIGCIAAANWENKKRVSKGNTSFARLRKGFHLDLAMYTFDTFRLGVTVKL